MTSPQKLTAETRERRVLRYLCVLCVSAVKRNSYQAASG